MAGGQNTVTIPAGEALSNPINCAGFQIVGVMVPEEWDPARLSFQVSPNNNDYYDLFWSDNTEAAINVTPGTWVQFDKPPVKFPSNTTMWVRARSGTRALEKPQSDDVTLTLVLI